MSVRTEILCAARRAPRLLGPATGKVVEFLLGCLNADGGFRGRARNSDLYYTVFGLDALEALGISLDRESTERYLETFGDGAELDFVHSCCLARCWAAIGKPEARGRRDLILSRIEAHRSTDGGYALSENNPVGNPYGCFLALCAYEDLQCQPPNVAGVVRCLTQNSKKDGSWSNVPSYADGTHEGSTLATCAAAIVLNHYTPSAIPASRNTAAFDSELTGKWLLGMYDGKGGFRAGPCVPIPDLLSTAVAVHTLSVLGLALGGLKNELLGFLSSLWDNTGGFRGYWGDDQADAEYTFYGLVALGHLVASD